VTHSWISDLRSTVRVAIDAGKEVLPRPTFLVVVRADPGRGLVLLPGVDRFIKQTCAVTNLIGNGIATFTFAR